MAPKRSKVPGTAATVSHVVPICSVCKTRMQKDDQNEWFCLSCADDWLKEYISARTGGKSIGGVILPARVSDPRKETPSFLDVLPNRRARRRSR